MAKGIEHGEKELFLIDSMLHPSLTAKPSDTMIR